MSHSPRVCTQSFSAAPSAHTEIYSKFLVFVVNFLETFSGMLLASIGFVVFDCLLIVLNIIYYVFITCCFCFVVVAAVSGLGSIAFRLF